MRHCFGVDITAKVKIEIFRSGGRIFDTVIDTVRFTLIRPGETGRVGRIRIRRGRGLRSRNPRRSIAARNLAAAVAPKTSASTVRSINAGRMRRGV